MKMKRNDCEWLLLLLLLLLDTTTTEPLATSAALFLLPPTVRQHDIYWQRNKTCDVHLLEYVRTRTALS